MTPRALAVHLIDAVWRLDAVDIMEIAETGTLRFGQTARVVAQSHQHDVPASELRDAIIEECQLRRETI